MKLYWHPFSIFPRRVRVALLEKQLAFEDVLVDLPRGATRSAEFRRLNPFGQVPVLEDDGLVIYESLAILEYLEERHPTPALLPADAANRARTRQLMYTAGDFAPPLKRWLTRLFEPEAAWDRPDQERAATELAAHLDILETLLPEREYLAGSAFSLADVAYVPLVCELEMCLLGHLLPPRPAVHAWTNRLRARPSVKATSPAQA